MSCDSAPAYPVEIGDRVHNGSGLKGVVRAFYGDKAWVEHGGPQGCFSTARLELLRVLPRPRVGMLMLLPSAAQGGLFTYQLPPTPAVELTDEVRERIQDLL